MKTLKTRMISALGAAAMILSVPLVSMASSDDPTPQEVTYAVNNLPVEITKLLGILSIAENQVGLVHIEDILTGDQLVNVQNTLNKLTTQLQLVTLHNVLNNLDVLTGDNLITIGDILSNNDVDMDDVVGTYLFPNGDLLVFCCETCD